MDGKKICLLLIVAVFSRKAVGYDFYDEIEDDEDSGVEEDQSGEGSSSSWVTEALWGSDAQEEDQETGGSSKWPSVQTSWNGEPVHRPKHRPEASEWNPQPALLRWPQQQNVRSVKPKQAKWPAETSVWFAADDNKPQNYHWQNNAVTNTVPKYNNYHKEKPVKGSAASKWNFATASSNPNQAQSHKSHKIPKPLQPPSSFKSAQPTSGYDWISSPGDGDIQIHNAKPQYPSVNFNSPQPSYSTNQQSYTQNQPQSYQSYNSPQTSYSTNQQSYNQNQPQNYQSYNSPQTSYSQHPTAQAYTAPQAAYIPNQNSYETHKTQQQTSYDHQNVYQQDYAPVQTSIRPNHENYPSEHNYQNVQKSTQGNSGLPLNLGPTKAQLWLSSEKQERLGEPKPEPSRDAWSRPPAPVKESRPKKRQRDVRPEPESTSWGYSGGHADDFYVDQDRQSLHHSHSNGFNPTYNHNNLKQEPVFYAYEYKVNDPETGDMKGHKEKRDGDKVEGYYMLMDADGSMREVHYTADDEVGFVAKVTKTEDPNIRQYFGVNPKPHHSFHWEDSRNTYQSPQAYHRSGYSPAETFGYEADTSQSIQHQQIIPFSGPLPTVKTEKSTKSRSSTKGHPLKLTLQKEEVVDVSPTQAAMFISNTTKPKNSTGSVVKKEMYQARTQENPGLEVVYQQQRTELHENPSYEVYQQQTRAGIQDSTGSIAKKERYQARTKENQALDMRYQHKLSENQENPSIEAYQQQPRAGLQENPILETDMMKTISSEIDLARLPRYSALPVKYELGKKKKKAISREPKKSSPITKTAAMKHSYGDEFLEKGVHASYEDYEETEGFGDYEYGSSEHDDSGYNSEEDDYYPKGSYSTSYYKPKNTRPKYNSKPRPYRGIRNERPYPQTKNVKVPKKYQEDWQKYDDDEFETETTSYWPSRESNYNKHRFAHSGHTKIVKKPTWIKQSTSKPETTTANNIYDVIFMGTNKPTQSTYQKKRHVDAYRGFSNRGIVPNRNVEQPITEPPHPEHNYQFFVMN